MQRQTILNGWALNLGRDGGMDGASKFFLGACLHGRGPKSWGHAMAAEEQLQAVGEPRDLPTAAHALEHLKPAKHGPPCASSSSRSQPCHPLPYLPAQSTCRAQPSGCAPDPTTTTTTLPVDVPLTLLPACSTPNHADAEVHSCGCGQTAPPARLVPRMDRSHPQVP